MNLKQTIRKIAHWPKKGVHFKDITTILQDKNTFKYVIDNLTKPFIKSKVDKVVGIDARGFLLASPVAYKLGCGVSLVRKKGRLPYHSIEETYDMEYGENTLTIHKDTIRKGEKVIIVDDLIATGGTVMATVKLVERLGGVVVGISFIIDLPYLKGSEKLKEYPLYYLVHYDSE